MGNLTLAVGIVTVVFTGLLALTILVWIWQGKLPLYRLISEPNGDASLSRLQLLIFTFVIALSLFLIIVGNGTELKFPDIPPAVLTLLGISSSSYLVSKGIQFSSPAGLARPSLSISPPTSVGVTSSLLLTASVVNATSGTPTPNLTWSLEAPAHGAITPKPPNEAQYDPPITHPSGATVTIRVTSQGFDDAIATLTLA